MYLIFTSKCSLYRLFHIIFAPKNFPICPQLIPSCYLSMFMLSPRLSQIEPQIFPTCSALITSFFPQCVHSLLLRFCQILPPTFSLSTTEYLILAPIYSFCPLQITLSFIPQNFPSCTILISSFLLQKFALSPIHHLSFSLKNATSLPLTSPLIFLHKQFLCPLSTAPGFQLKMSPLSPLSYPRFSQLGAAGNSGRAKDSREQL